MSHPDWSKVDKNGPGGCWLWLGKKDEANTYTRPNGHRDCRTCIRNRARRRAAA